MSNETNAPAAKPESASSASIKAANAASPEKSAEHGIISFVKHNALVVGAAVVALVIVVAFLVF